MPSSLATVGGTRPAREIIADVPDCPDPRWECAWGIRADGRWWLKYINQGCPAHQRKVEIPLVVTKHHSSARWDD